MKVLVTGGAGFIGSHLTEALLGRGDEVVVFDNLSTGRTANLEEAMANPNLRLVQGSVLDEELLAPLVAEADLVYHLAASVGVSYVVEHLIETIHNNVRGTETVIRLAQQSPGTKVILASTSEVYGKSDSFPHREDDDLTIGPTTVGRWGYACSKMMDELLGLAYHKEQGLPIVILRLFNTVGPRQSGRYGMVIPNFVSRALTGDPIEVFGDGSQTRCFVHVKHVIKGLVDISGVDRAVGQVFNIGSNQEISINELAEQVKTTLESPSPIVHIPYKDAYGFEFEDIQRRVPDIAKIQAHVDFSPATDLPALITEVAQHLRSDTTTGLRQSVSRT